MGNLNLLIVTKNVNLFAIEKIISIRKRINFSSKRGETNLVMNGKGPTKRKATAMNMLPTMETADGYLMRSQIWKFLLFLKNCIVLKFCKFCKFFEIKSCFLISDLLKKLIFELYFCNNSVVNYKTGEWDFLTFTQEEETLFYKLLQAFTRLVKIVWFLIRGYML